MQEQLTRVPPNAKEYVSTPTMPSEKLMDILKLRLPLKQLNAAKKDVVRLDAMDGLTIEGKGMIFFVSIWAGDPYLKSGLAKALGLTQEMVRSCFDTIATDSMLGQSYSQLTEPLEEPSDSPRAPSLKTTQSTPLISRIMRMRRQGYGLQEIIQKTGSPARTVYTYNSMLTTSGKVPRFGNNNRPRPETLELDKFVAKLIRTAAKKGQKISNRDIVQQIQQNLDREVTVSMVQRAVRRASLREKVPKRGNRKTSKTWSPTKEEGEKTKERVRQALIYHSQKNPGQPVVLFNIARDLSLHHNYVRKIYDSIAEEEDVPPTKHKPHNSQIPLETLRSIKEALVQAVNRQREKNPNKPISIARLMRELGRSRELISRLYIEIYGQ